MVGSLPMVAATALRETICTAEDVDRKATRLVAEHQPPCPCGQMLLQDIGRNVQACHAHFAMKKAAVQTNPAKTTTGQRPLNSWSFPKCGLEPKKKKKKECCMDGCVDALFSDHIRMLLYDIDRNVQACHAHFAMKKAAVQTNPARRRPAK
ncbi:hypothetical protein MRX96_025823 [Rhipicephalus microplus]